LFLCINDSQLRPTAKQRDTFSDQKLLFLMHCLLPISGLTMTFLLPAGVANCSTVEAKTPELADVKAVIVSAYENDTVNVPAGTASWTSTLIITKGITLQGATGIEGSLDNRRARQGDRADQGRKLFRCSTMHSPVELAPHFILAVV
jgi:hypothetical protein